MRDLDERLTNIFSDDTSTAISDLVRIDSARFGVNFDKVVTFESNERGLWLKTEYLRNGSVINSSRGRIDPDNADLMEGLKLRFDYLDSFLKRIDAAHP